MRRTLLITSFIFLGVAPANAADAKLSSIQAAGENQFQQYCSSCHGMDARGKGPTAVALVKAPANLRTIAQRRGGTFPEDEILGLIDGRNEISAHGNREMPVWGRAFSEAVGGGSLGEEYSSGKFKVLIEYLKAIQE